MEIRNRTTGAVITDSQLRADNPNTSFPKQITADIFDGFGVQKINGTNNPLINENNQNYIFMLFYDIINKKK